MNTNTLTADQINEHLKNDGVVMVATQLKSTIYDKRHAGMFYTGNDKNVWVRRGKSADCLTYDAGQRTSITIALGHYK